MKLRQNSGSILVYILVIFIFIINWSLVVVARLSQSIIDKHHLKLINKRLDLEIEIMKRLDINECPDTFTFKETTVIFTCSDNMVTIAATGAVNTSLSYVIIDDESMKWRIQE